MLSYVIVESCKDKIWELKALLTTAIARVQNTRGKKTKKRVDDNVYCKFLHSSSEFPFAKVRILIHSKNHIISYKILL